jgi:transcriptional regulator with XRE-family HTH domain
LAVPKFRPSTLLEARQQAGLTQVQLAALADAAAKPTDLAPDDPEERARRVEAWASRISAWEGGVDAPSAPYVPPLARVLGIDPLALFVVDPAAPTFTALRLAAGKTIVALADATGIAYTSLHRMVRGVSQLSDTAAQQLAVALQVTPDEVVAAIARELD